MEIILRAVPLPVKPLEFAGGVLVSIFRMLSINRHQVHTLLVRSGKFIVAMAATWALGASLFIFSQPITAHGVTSVLLRDSSTVVETFSREQSWYEAQGLWGILGLVVFSGIYLAAVSFAWRGKYKALAIISAVALALSIVTGFSIGGAYLPAALGLFVGSVMLLSTRLMRSQR